MPKRLKKTRSAGRFRDKHGRKVRSRIANIEDKQKTKQKCPFCEAENVKRKSKGIWECKKCGKKFASDAYYLE
ncbi:MAG TPA: 50S ribosomal protein L37ae [Candidatus Nanoarchaeia archaeon]|nr:50S ribosomal protein L37ae [Candidatus Nanoarchaeia archaeon]